MNTDYCKYLNCRCSWVPGPALTGRPGMTACGRKQILHTLFRWDSVSPRFRPALGTACSALDAAHGQAGGHAAAEGVIGRDRRQGVDDRGRHHVVPRCHVAIEEL